MKEQCAKAFDSGDLGYPYFVFEFIHVQRAYAKVAKKERAQFILVFIYTCKAEIFEALINQSTSYEGDTRTR